MPTVVPRKALFDVSAGCMYMCRVFDGYMPAGESKQRFVIAARSKTTPTEPSKWVLMYISTGMDNGHTEID